jgi:hypothetical protein
VTKISVEHECLKELLNVPPQTLMSGNGLTLAHYVGWVIKPSLMGSPGALPNLMGRGLE